MSEIISVNCPITLAPMIDAYKCIDCNHNFSDVIIDLVNRHQYGYSCPVAGCKTIIRKASIVKDPKFSKLVRRHLAHQVENE
jgi:SUMO ligase MMS21 Smc5/6 complex component